MSWSYRPSLDGLRMVAMYVIVLVHTQTPTFSGGFIAVNLFFVLSGYLVTNVVLTEMDRTGTVSLRNFYARRVRRLLPAALVAIVGTSLLFVLIEPVTRRLSIVGDAQSSLLYVANWRFIAQANDYFAADFHKSPFLHYWTLSIEEQFYVVFPVLLLLLSKVGRARTTFAVLAAICALSIGAQFYWAQADPMHAYYGTDARMYQLAAGALLAVGLRIWRARVSARAASAAGMLGMLSFAVLCLDVLEMSRAVRGVAGTAACVLLIGGLMLAEDQPLGRLLSRRTPVYLGKISYATYLWHWPIVLVLAETLDVGPVLMAVLAGVAATAMAAASAELLELPIRQAKRLDRFPWQTALVGVACSALVAVTLVPWALKRDRPPALVAAQQAPGQGAVATTTEQAKPEKLPEKVDWKAVDQDTGQEHSCTVEDPDGCIVHRGQGPHILLIGDSHARMLSRMFTKLAEDQDFTLSMNVVAGCPWQENLKNLQSSRTRQQQCTDARVGWYDKVLPKLKPDLVVLVESPRDNAGHWKTRLTQRDGRQDGLHQAILGATNATLQKIDAAADRVLMVQSIIAPEKWNPDDCLTRTGDPAKCTVPVPDTNRPTDGFYLAAAAQHDDFYTVNLNSAFCPTAPVCLPVRKGQIVWRDSHHLTAKYAAQRRDAVWKLIKRSGALDGLTGT